MKHSIKSIFRNISLFLISIVIFAAFEVLVDIDNSSSYTKVENLNNQKHIISTLTNFSKDDIELALIQFNGKSKQLHNEIEKLRRIYEYNFTEKYILSNSKEYLSDLDKLTSLTTTFNNKASEYYTKKSEEKKLKENNLNRSLSSLLEHIDSMILKTVTYNNTKFNIHKNITFIAFIIILLLSIWYRKRLKNIYKDLEFLYHVDKKNYTIFSKEVDAISLRMKRKPVTSDNPTMIDPVTGINNQKGMMNAYAEKKGMKESNFTSVTLLEIDNFSKSNRVYSQELTQIILKKIAFTISLHEQAADVIARTDYNQFTIILSRASKEQSFKDIDIIRQSISELKLSSNELGAFEVTVSGGYIAKPNNMNLEEAIKEAKKVLQYSKEQGRNRISQVRDLAASEL